ncbi:hypothetical protein [Lentzea flava]|uniref:Uncharacterized protein n=1 Tax=Lentzea flava TaxID=103732 RepID=A0ABQ2VE16_9PSEU|nr:hypothetical protein [Lentzea flava]MCP2204354.1 hypothetical protein [Lentzea flava]GGU76743.1 hypothetical protein GCM10010178_79930 [Lentzea flava]
MNLLTNNHRERRGGDREMIGHMIGNALVVHPRSVLREEIRDLALSLAPDPDHELVVVDLPSASSFSVWESTAKLLPRKRRGVRLVLGGRSREMTVLAGQWLSERLGRTVIAPDGQVMPGVGGSLFVDAGWGTGWVRFQPGKQPRLDGKRFPRPVWENVSSSFVEVMPTSASGVAEPLPGGVWLRPRGPESVLRDQRNRLINTLPCQPEVCTIVLGCPGAPPITLYDITRFFSWIPPEARPTLRLMKFGPMTLPGNVPYGQVLADALEHPVTCYTGIPLGSRTEPTVHALQANGEPGWQAFAEEVIYSPSEAGAPVGPPALVKHRPPVVGVDEIAPAVYQYTQDVVLEVVQAGLWLRGQQEAPHAAAIRSVEPDGGRHLVVFEHDTEEMAARLRVLAEDVIGRLPSWTRHVTALAPAESVVRNRIEVPGKAMSTIDVSSVVTFSAPRAESALSEVDMSSSPPVEVPAAPNEATVRFDRPQIETGNPMSSSPPAPALSSLDADAPSSPIGLVAEPSPQRAGSTAGPSLELPPADVAVVDLPVTAPALISADAPSSPVPASPVPGSPVSAPSVSVSSVPTSSADEVPVAEPVGQETATALAEPGAEPTHTRFVTLVQPTPQPAAAGLVPKRGLDEERAWLRRALSREYAAVANSVSRVLSEHPGFQGALERSGAVLSDAVAIRLYLSSSGDGLDLQLRKGTVGPHVPFARCVVSGLSRLPSHRGATVFSTSMTGQEWELYRNRKLLTEWGFVNALVAPCSRQRARHEVDVLVWSMTARRTKLLEPEQGPVDDRVLFVPGTSFKVLDLREPVDGGRGYVLLRELAAGEIDSTGKVDTNRASLDELAVNSLRRSLQTWESGKLEARVPESAVDRFGQLPGLVRTRQEESR